MDEKIELVEEVAESNQILRELNQEIERLRAKGRNAGQGIRNFYQNNQKFIKENRQLMR